MLISGFSFDQEPPDGKPQWRQEASSPILVDDFYRVDDDYDDINN